MQTSPKAPRLSAGILLTLGLGLIALLTVGGLLAVDAYVDGRGGGEVSDASGAAEPGAEQQQSRESSEASETSATADIDDTQTDASETDETDTGENSPEETQPAQASENEEIPPVDLPEFIMPSGNVACSGIHGSVICTIAEKHYDLPGEAECEFEMGVELAETAEPLCLDEGWNRLLRDKDLPVLSYGQQAVFGPITCDSRDTGIECRNDNGAGFTLRRSDYVLQ